MFEQNKHKIKTALPPKGVNIPFRGKLLLLIAFCVLTGSACLMIAKNSFSGGAKLSLTIIQMPEHIRSDMDESRTAFPLGQEEYQRIQSFKQHMDSLINSSYGQEAFDSIISARPGLMDSILIIENLYQSQTDYLNYGKTAP